MTSEPAEVGRPLAAGGTAPLHARPADAGPGAAHPRRVLPHAVRRTVRRGLGRAPTSPPTRTRDGRRYGAGPGRPRPSLGSRPPVVSVAGRGAGASTGPSPATTSTAASPRSRRSGLRGGRPGRGLAGAEIEWVRAEAAKHAWIRGAVVHMTVEDPVEASARSAATRRTRSSSAFAATSRTNAGVHRGCGLAAGIRLLGEAGTSVRRLRPAAPAAGAGPAGRHVSGHHDRSGSPRQATGDGPR